MSTTAHVDSEASRLAARWGLSFVLVLAAHAWVVLVLSRHPDTHLPPLEPPAVLLDLEPRPEPVAEPAPEPPPPPSEPVAAAPEPPPVEPPPPEEVQVPPEPEPPPPPPPTLELPPPPRPLPPPQPRIPRPKPAPTVIQQPVPVPRPAAPVPAPATPAPAVWREAVAAATTSWQGRLQAHLARFKRYPPQAQMARQEGTPLLRFTMTRDGRVLSFGLAGGSGHEALDREALDLMQRAQPLPALPPEVPQATIQLVVPLRFQLK